MDSAASLLQKTSQSKRPQGSSAAWKTSAADSASGGEEFSSALAALKRSDSPPCRAGKRARRRGQGKAVRPPAQAMPTRNRARIRKRLPLPRAQPLLPRTEALHSNLLRPNPPRKRQGSRRRRGTRAAPMPEAAMLRRQRRRASVGGYNGHAGRQVSLQNERFQQRGCPERNRCGRGSQASQPTVPTDTQAQEVAAGPNGNPPAAAPQNSNGTDAPVPAPLRPKPIRLSRPSRKRLAQPPLRLLKQQGRRLRAPLNRVERKGQPLRCPRPKHRQKRRIRATPMSCRTLPPTLLQQARPA